MELSGINQSQGKRGTNLLYAIGIAVGIAILMTTVTTYSFYHSGAYTTVKQIQTGVQFVNSLDIEAIDAKAPINASDIDKYAQSIRAKLQTLEDEKDFGPQSVSDGSLGLN